MISLGGDGCVKCSFWEHYCFFTIYHKKKFHEREQVLKSNSVSNKMEKKGNTFKIFNSLLYMVFTEYTAASTANHHNLLLCTQGHGSILVKKHQTFFTSIKTASIEL